MNNNEIIKDLISRVNKTLSFYEKDFISVKRTPLSEKERCSSFEQFIEARFNYECCRIPELYNAVIETEGHLFTCVSIEEPNIAKRRFKMAKVVLLDPSTISEEENRNNLKEEILQIYNFIGGSSISFNNVKRKIKFKVE